MAHGARRTSKLFFAIAAMIAATAHAQQVVATVPTTPQPIAVAVNPSTNRIYVANSEPNGIVTVIDGATDTISAVQVGMNPDGIAVNPVTNKIYVANADSDSVTVIDGATNAPTNNVAPWCWSRFMP
jgi:YVTN family beta-propeller protein